VLPLILSAALIKKEKKMKSIYSPPVLPMGPNVLSWKMTGVLGGNLKRQWIEDGFAVIPNVFSLDQIQRYNAIVANVREDVDDGKDANGFGDRIGQLHQKEPDLLELASSAKVVSFLKWALGDDPVLMGSLQFQKGTTQEAHIDAIFFWPEPAYSMAGVWVALEDIHEDSGPLFYLPGSHRWPFHRSEDIAHIRPDLAERRVAAIKGKLTLEERGTLIIKLEQQYQVPRMPICMKAGDVVIWHSLLAHGGSPRNDVTRSRLSAVFHYLGKRAKLFTFDQFMLYDNAELLQQQPANPEIRQYNGIPFMYFPHFVTYSGGKEILHPV
jgi:ectoine hydroxylase-related dioxygenase (phytanoyl-CoA dioxygenase family)